MLLDVGNTMEDAPNVHDHNIMHNDEATSADFAVDVPVSERPKLYTKTMHILKLKHERRLSQVAIDGLISDTTTYLKNLYQLKMKSYNVWKKDMYQQS